MHAKFVAEHRLVDPDMHDQPSPCRKVYNQSDGQEISRFLWNLQAHYCVHRRSLPDYILRHFHFNIVILSMPNFVKQSVRQTF